MKDGYCVHLANPAAIRQYDGLKYSGDFADAAYLALRGPVRRMMRIYQSLPNSVECFLIHSALCINTDEVPQVDSAPVRNSPQA